MRHPSPSRTNDLVSAALVASLMAATSWVAGMFQPVPVSLQTLFVVLAALLLSPGWAMASMLTYVLLGVAGLPVFAQGKAGVGVLLGPTGGYLVGFIVAATLAAALRRLLEGRLKRLLVDGVAAAVVLLTVYAVGAAWLAWSLRLSPGAAIAAGVLPFVVGDAVKAFVATGVASAVRRARGL